MRFYFYVSENAPDLDSLYAKHHALCSVNVNDPGIKTCHLELCVLSWRRGSSKRRVHMTITLNYGRTYQGFFNKTTSIVFSARLRKVISQAERATVPTLSCEERKRGKYRSSAKGVVKVTCYPLTPLARLGREPCLPPAMLSCFIFRFIFVLINRQQVYNRLSQSIRSWSDRKE
jgi:hypothetical protein